MNRLFAAAVVVFAASSIQADAQDAAVKKALEGKYAQFIGLMKKKDVKGIMGMATKNFTVKNAAGKVQDAKQVEAELTQQLANMPPIVAYKNTITSLKVSGDTAVAGTSSQIKMEGKDPQGAKHTIDISGTSKDTWKKVGGDWKMFRVEDGPQKIKVDGKDLPQAGSAPLTPATPNPSFTPGKKKG